MRILVWHHKYGPRLYVADTDARLYAAAASIIRTALDEGMYGAIDEEEEKYVEQVLDEYTPCQLWFWLCGRRDYEYECTELMEAKLVEPTVEERLPTSDDHFSPGVRGFDELARTEWARAAAREKERKEREARGGTDG